jgi:hypothetical protein
MMLRTDKGKEFLNKTFQDMLKHEGIEFQICKNPDVKCAVIELRSALLGKSYLNISLIRTFTGL